MSKDKYANKKRELLAWAKNDIIPTDLRWLCESAADIIEVLQSALVTATRELDKAKTENVDLQAGINSGVARYDRLWAELDTANAENKALKEFARHVIRIECWSIFEQDGDDLQDLAEKLGLIVSCTATQEDADDDRYSDLGFEVDDMIKRFSDVLKE